MDLMNRIMNRKKTSAVVTYKGRRKLEYGLRQAAKHGWEVQTHTTAGKIHTVTYKRASSD